MENPLDHPAVGKARRGGRDVKQSRQLASIKRSYSRGCQHPLNRPRVSQVYPVSVFVT